MYENSMEIMHADIRVYEVKDETIWVVCNFPRIKSDKKKIIVNCVKKRRGVGGGSRDYI